MHTAASSREGDGTQHSLVLDCGGCNGKMVSQPERVTSGDHEDEEDLADLERRAANLACELAEEEDTQKKLKDLIGSLTQIIDSIVESQSVCNRSAARGGM